MTDTLSPMPDATEGSISGGFIYDNEHPQLQIPFTARVGARRLEGKTLSITEAYVSGLRGSLLACSLSPTLKKLATAASLTTRCVFAIQRRATLHRCAT
jgi:hypothetical protein